MKFLVGDRVTFINETSKGIVSEIQSENTLIVLLDEGIAIPVHKDEIILDSGGSTLIKETKIINKDVTSKPNRQTSKGVLPSKPPKYLTDSILAKHYSSDGIIVDLHIEELTEASYTMSKYELFNLQMDYFHNCVNAAIIKKIKKLIFIHGIGSGKLKLALRTSLKNDYGLTFYDAPLHKFGVGATEVIIN